VIVEQRSVIGEQEQIIDLLEHTERKIIDARISQEIIDDISVALLEAVNNAIIHGNQRNREKSVDVRIAIEENKIEICVSDEGTGFDPSALADPSAPENLFRPNGRGLYFMHKLMDEVEIHSTSHGSEVIMRKYRIKP